MSEITCITCGKVLSDPLEMYGPVHLEQCRDCFLAGIEPVDVEDGLENVSMDDLQKGNTNPCPPTKP